MQIVINIPDKVYEMVMNTGTYGCYRFNSTKAIREGVPLPEEYGRLGDFKHTSEVYYEYLDQVKRYIANTPTIIPAAESEENNDNKK